MFYIGLDLGQRQDHTAIAILERQTNRLLVRRAERLPLGMPYPAVVERVKAIVTALSQSVLIVDGTGVGIPVVELLRRAGLPCEVIAVTITGGDRESGSGASWSVPKRDLIAGIQVALEKHELRIAKRMKEVAALIRELTDVRIKATRIGAEGAGQHDDLVIALALACWRARRRENTYGRQRLPGI